MLKIKTTYIDDALKQAEEKELLETIKKAHKTLLDRNGPGREFTGWLDLPTMMNAKLPNLNQTAQHLKEKHDVLVVVGIGGSYLGAKAAIEALKPYFKADYDMEIIFAGHHMSSEYLLDLKAYLKEKSFAINVISKSGTTIEPAIAFRMLKQLLEEKVGKEEAKKRIVATTDANNGALRKLADKEGYETYVIADDIGGRYSVLSPVGLLPMAVAGIDIEAVLEGAQIAQEELNRSTTDNPVYRYVLTRHAMLNAGKTVELLGHYEPKLHFLTEWWKQLFGESEGKNHKGLFVSSVGFTTDLHSLGQYIQDGKRLLFETIINIKEPKKDTYIAKSSENLDGLNYLEATSIDTINKKAMQGTLLAHMDGEAPSLVLELDRLDAKHFGYLIYFFELSCAISGYVLGVNPFDQPGVEAYKKNMFALLEKPGFESETKHLKERLKDVKKTR